MANIGTSMSPVITEDFLTEKGVTIKEDWQHLFYMLAGMNLVAFVCYALVMEGKPNQALN